MQDAFTGIPTRIRGRHLPDAAGRAFRTITSDDWTRSLNSARRQSNAISEQIRTVISSSLPKTK